jgi:DNA-binding transcriptional LysR family regulator
MPVFTTAIRCFEEIARRGSIRKSAEYLNLTPSAVNRQILALEEELSTALFERLPRGVRLTAAGELLLASVRRQEQDFHLALSQIEGLKGIRRGHVSIASLSHFASIHLPAFLAQQRSDYPGITFSVLAGSSEDVVQMVSDGRADIGISFRPSRAAVVKIVKAIPVRLGAVMSVRHPLSNLKQISLRECMTYPLALPVEGMESRTFAEHMGLRRWTDRTVTVETNSFTVLMQMIKADIGLGFLSDFDAAPDVSGKSLAFVPISDAGAPSPQLCSIMRADRTLPFATAVILEKLSAFLDQLLADTTKQLGLK